MDVAKYVTVGVSETRVRRTITNTRCDAIAMTNSKCKLRGTYIRADYQTKYSPNCRRRLVYSYLYEPVHIFKF